MDYKSISPEALTRACLESGEEPAWTEFIRRFHPLIARAVLRVSRQWGEASPQVVDDLVQETYLKLCAERASVLRNFSSSNENSIYAFIKVFTANLVHDQLKAAHAKKRGGSSSTTSVDSEVLEPRFLVAHPPAAALERRLLIEKVALCLSGSISGPNAERDRRIFWLYYRAGLSAHAIAEIPSVALGTKGVESIILRLTRVIRQKLTGRKEETRLSQSRLEGISP